MHYNFTNLSKVPLPHRHVNWCIWQASEDAGNPYISIHDCPYGWSEDPFFKYCRLIWRVAFTTARQVASNHRLANRYNEMTGREELIAA